MPLKKEAKLSIIYGWFRQLKNSDEVLNELKSTGVCASSLSTYDFLRFIQLYTTLPLNLINRNVQTL